MRRHRVRADDRVMTRSITAVLTALAVAGCGGSGDGERNKAGAEAATSQHVLFLESTDAGTPESQYFVKRLEARSDGALRATILQTYPATEPGQESRLARALREGEADFGILPARAWPAAGVPALGALLAPFVIGDYDVARRAMSGAAGRAAADALERGGVVPLAVAPTQLRRVIARMPLLTPDDFRGRRIRISDSEAAAGDLRALGAAPVEGMPIDAISGALERGRLDGVESSPGLALGNGYFDHAKNITGYALFPRIDTLVASRAAWEELSDAERSAVRAAAADTARFSATLPDRDAASLGGLCQQGVRIATPTAAQLAALADAAEPARASLRDDPATAELMRLLETTPGAGPKPLPGAGGCEERTARRSQKSGSAAIPEGVYKVTTTREDNQRFGLPGAEWDIHAKLEWTTRMKDGKWVRTVDPPFAEQPGKYDDAGTYEVHGDEVTIHYTISQGAPDETYRWSYYGGRLTFEPIGVDDLGSLVVYSAHPWRKAG
jgi:TRAP-type C4-dicarboxylate transport system substrate-binding protein